MKNANSLIPNVLDLVMKHVRFEAVIPNIQRGETMNAYEKRFPTPAADFELHEIHLDKGDQYPVTATTVDILIVTEGDITAEVDGIPVLSSQRGDSLMLVAGAAAILKSRTGAQIFKATVPIQG